MRPIDADKFVLALMDASLSSVDEDTILDLVDSIHTVDAVPVVRCKDCQWVDRPGCCPLHLSNLTEGGEALPKKDDFCSYGERKES